MIYVSYNAYLCVWERETKSIAPNMSYSWFPAPQIYSQLLKNVRPTPTFCVNQKSYGEKYAVSLWLKDDTHAWKELLDIRLG